MTRAVFCNAFAEGLAWAQRVRFTGWCWVVEPSVVQQRALVCARLCAQLAFIASPLRWRLVLMEHRVPNIYSDYTDVLIHATDIFVLATLVCAAVATVARHRLKESACFGQSDSSHALRAAPKQPVSVTFTQNVAGSPVVACLSVLVFSLAVSTALAIDPLVAAQHALRWLLTGAWGWVVWREMRALKWWVTPAILLLISQALVAIGQTISQHDLGLRALGEYWLDPLQPGISVIALNGTRWLRAYGLADHPNLLGGALALGLLVPWAAVRHSKAGLLYTATMLAAQASGTVALYFTFSRSAWLGFGAGMVLLIVLRARAFVTFGASVRSAVGSWRAAQVFASAAVLAAALAWMGALGIARLDTQSSLQQAAPVLEREFLIARTLDVFRLHPIAGVGINNLPLALRALFPSFPVNYAPAHVVPLAAAAEVGAIGSIAFTLVCLWPMLAALRARHQHNEHRLALPLLACIIMIGVFDYYPWTYAPGRLWLALALALNYDD